MKTLQSILSAQGLTDTQVLQLVSGPAPFLKAIMEVDLETLSLDELSTATNRFYDLTSERRALAETMEAGEMKDNTLKEMKAFDQTETEVWEIYKSVEQRQAAPSLRR